MTTEYIAATSGPNVKFDEQNMKNSLSKTLAGLASSFAIDLYTAPTNVTTDAAGTFSEVRLRIKVAPLITIVAALIILSLLSLLIGLLGDTINPGLHDTWAGHARVLTSSRELRSLLLPLNIVSTRTMTRALGTFRFKMVHGRSICIEDRGSSSRVTSDVHGRGEGWTPLAARWYMLTVAFLLPVIAIILVEVLWQVSIKHDGVLSISDAGSVKAYAIRYASTLTALWIATIFNNLDFAIAVLAPFSALVSRKATLNKVAQSYFIGSLPPVALYHALINGQFGASLSMIATIIGSVLTIVTSGFWYDAISLHGQEVSISRGSFWDVDWDASAGDAGAGVRFNDIQHGAVAPSIKVWSDFVLPDLSTPVQQDALSSTSGSPLDISGNNFAFMIPALRPRTNCEAVDRSGLRFVPKESEDATTFGISALVALPDHCVEAGSTNRTLKITSYFPSRDIFEGESDIAWYGKFSDLTLEQSLVRLVNATPPITNDPTNLTLDHAGCPTMSLTFGYTSIPSMPDEDLADKAVVLLCYQQIEQVPLTATFIGDPARLRLSSEHPPVPDEAKAIYLTRQGSTSPYFDYNITHSLFDNLRTFSTSLPIHVDVLLNVLIVGPNGTGVDAIRPPAGSGRLIRAVERLFTVYMLEAIDLNMRRRTADAERPADQPALLYGTMTSSHLRFKVDRASKIGLEVMLAVMVVLEGGALALLQLRGVLPQNPCSLASSMALVAGSRFCDDLEAESIPKEGNEKGVENISAKERVSLGGWNVRNSAAVPAGSEREAAVVAEDGRGGYVEEMEAALAEGKQGGETWFGIDLGTAEVLGFNRKANWWRRRRSRRRRLRAR